MKRSLCVLAVLFLLPFYTLFAGGVKGIIKSADAGALSYASIFVKQTGTGVVSDANGAYELSLSPGQYDIVFQFLGYETVSRSVQIGNEFIELNIELKTQAIVLENVIITAGKEDPAYTIMRKAIAKSKYHTQQLDKYSARVYIKGKGQLKDYPWMAKKMMEKEGITKDRVFITESVSEITYTRPKKFEEKVIAVYNKGKANNTSPNMFVFGSFYEAEIAETVSPLSPVSFSYYKFEYLGTFKDRNYEISKIKVTPRSKGDNVFDGTLYIVEDWWSIHSLDLHTTKLGIDFKVRQIYNPIEDKAWLPVSQNFDVSGKVFGFDFYYNYLATVKDYKITLNPKLPQEMKVIDATVEKEQAKQIEKQYSKKGQQLQQRLEAGSEVTNKELKQLTREFEKVEQQQQKEPEVISESTFSVDKLAFKKDSLFWTDMRPIPLTKEEERGYEKTDSIAEVERKRDEGDSLKPSKNKGFQIWDIFRGDSYRISETSNFRIRTPYGGFNTVEGFNIIYGVNYNKRWVKRDTTVENSRPEVKRLDITPLGRYSFARNKIVGFLRADYRTPTSRFTLEGGRYVRQFNPDEPIHHLVNTFTTLILGDNLMKIYERDYLNFNYREQLSPKYAIRSTWSWANRKELVNNSTFALSKAYKDSYTPNAPINEEIATTSFQDNKAFIGSIGVEARPWQKYRIRNGRKFQVRNSSPFLTVDYRKGFDGALKSSVNFDQIELGVKQEFRFGVRGTLDIGITAGKFLNNDSLVFMDYKHFLGNRTPFTTTDPAGSYRLLDYYNYSTSDQYFSGNAHYHFRKFLVTQFPKVRLTGISENIFVNYLATPTSKNYTELGYSIDGILRVFRLEAAAAFRDGKYLDYGFRIGIATNLTVNFDD
jgi:hypothetical protein